MGQTLPRRSGRRPQTGVVPVILHGNGTLTISLLNLLIGQANHRMDWGPDLHPAGPTRNAQFMFSSELLTRSSRGPRFGATSQYRRRIRFAERLSRSNKSAAALVAIKGKVAPRWPSATLDGLSAQRPTKIRSGRGDGSPHGRTRR